MGASVLVAALSSALGVLLITATGWISAILNADPSLTGSATMAIVLGIMSGVLLGIAVYVGAIVTANTFATVVAGRTRRIALLRLIGASARSQRREVATQGLLVGLIGAMLGLAGATALAAALIAAGGPLLGVADVPYTLVRGELLIPAAVVAVTTWLSAWAGSRRVLSVTPLQALGGAVEQPHAAFARRTGRNVAAVVVFVAGAALLGLGIVVGLASPFGVLIAFAGGLLSFSGLILGSTLLMPPVLSLIGRALGRSAPARLAAENARRNPERSSRMAMGLVIGVTLITMFAVALDSTKAVLAASAGGELPPEMTAGMDAFTAIVTAVIAVSAVIAAVGLINLLTLGVVQRRRELGLLRALGQSCGQVRWMVLLEATHITVAAVLTGLVLGIGYGWAGAQSLLGSLRLNPDAPAHGTLVAPAMPLPVLGAMVVAAAVLTLVAAVVPTRLATRVAPIAALAE
ncbi:ABC transporter permease [Microbacterium rhizomatis]|uniref:ABC transporter permease n=2 Tax=Microbacterium rhizomatis TaxID=1631477 RepID=A0A5J5J5A2_9MICO|nr:ABC transporter permease [Microbacterium rhizomatis]KAA9108513.1 ABC transporter permease [Microbacterium rhizomatis]